MLDVVAAALAPERRLAPRPRPQLQANAPGVEPTLVITIQQACNLASQTPDAAPRLTAEDGTRRRFATITTARRAALVRFPLSSHVPSTPHRSAQRGSVSGRGQSALHLELEPRHCMLHYAAVRRMYA